MDGGVVREGLNATLHKNNYNLTTDKVVVIINNNMRLIKFRGWSIETQQWVYGGIHKVNRSVVILTGPNQVHFVETSSIGQFIGHRDINNVEIYENDIVTYYAMQGWKCADKDFRQYGTKVRPRQVVYKSGQFIPRSSYCKTNKGCCSWRHFDVEVIGNIHENPDLLK
jgi:uncharacterized phage protein (TIGR01671 family)